MDRDDTPLAAHTVTRSVFNRDNQNPEWFQGCHIRFGQSTHVQVGSCPSPMFPHARARPGRILTSKSEQLSVAPLGLMCHGPCSGEVQKSPSRIINIHGLLLAFRAWLRHPVAQTAGGLGTSPLWRRLTAAETSPLRHFRHREEMFPLLRSGQHFNIQDNACIEPQPDVVDITPHSNHKNRSARAIVGRLLRTLLSPHCD
jgi:hypothetical protein